MAILLYELRRILLDAIFIILEPLHIYILLHFVMIVQPDGMLLSSIITDSAAGHMNVF